MTTPGPLPDALVGPLLIELRDCLSAELARSLSGAPCRAYIPWDSGLPVADGCSCECDGGHGDAWVRFVRMDPDRPVQLGAAVGGPAGCPTAWIAVIELGVSRCHPTGQAGTQGYVPPDPQVLTDTALKRLSDGAALRRTVACCRALGRHAYGAGALVPLPPLGGCSGIAMSIQVEIVKTDPC